MANIWVLLINDLHSLHNREDKKKDIFNSHPTLKDNIFASGEY